MPARARGREIVTNGGRVLCAVGLGVDVRSAQRQAYDLVGAIHWNLVQYRRDIGYRAIEREADRVAAAQPVAYAAQATKSRS
jgi:phosphoribosylamine-glycine ligase